MGEGPAESDRPNYPYGLTLFLDYTTLKNMGLTDRDFDSGQPVTRSFSWRAAGVLG